jgi:hypothetical protein
MACDSYPRSNGSEPHDADRRKFLATCGKFAAVTPPALTVLLSTSLHSAAVAKSGGGDGNAHPDGLRWGHHHHHHHERDRDMLEWLERMLSKFV